jgi:hypothetical protein
MEERPRGELVAALVESIAARTESGNNRLARALLRRSWPGGFTDRSEPAALEWVRRWGPRGQVPLPPGCSCARGPCPVCN